MRYFLLAFGLTTMTALLAAPALVPHMVKILTSPTDRIEARDTASVPAAAPAAVLALGPLRDLPAPKARTRRAGRSGKPAPETARQPIVVYAELAPAAGPGGGQTAEALPAPRTAPIPARANLLKRGMAPRDPLPASLPDDLPIPALSDPGSLGDRGPRAAVTAPARPVMATPTPPPARLATAAGEPAPEAVPQAAYQAATEDTGPPITEAVAEAPARPVEATPAASAVNAEAKAPAAPTAEAEPAVQAPAKSAAKPQAQASAQSPKPPASPSSKEAKPRARGLYVIIGSFVEGKRARVLAREHAQWRPTLLEAEVDGKKRQRVAVGPFAPDQVKEALAEIKAAGIADAWQLKAPSSATAALSSANSFG